ncbi:hypothetical protein, partial [Lyngbya confervoides]
ELGFNLTECWPSKLFSYLRLFCTTKEGTLKQPVMIRFQLFASAEENFHESLRCLKFPDSVVL